MTGKTQNSESRLYGFSLIELLAVLVITSLVLISAISVYSQMQRAAREIGDTIENRLLPDEILQRIAEDLDKIVAPLSGQAADTKISVKNKVDEIYQSAQMKITRTYYDNKNEKQIFEEIIWQSNYEWDVNGLILYRSHSGLTVEDKLLGEEKSKSNRELFIPVAAGLTCFKIESLTGGNFVNAWTADALPRAVRISISFAAPYQDIDGQYIVPQSGMITRTVAIDRTRQIKFKFIPPDFNELGFGTFDSNIIEPLDANEMNEPNLSEDAEPPLGPGDEE